MKRVLKWISGTLALLSAAVGFLLFYRIRSQAGRALWVSKVTASAVSPFAVVLGGVGAALGLLSRSPLAFLAGLSGAFASRRYVMDVTAPHNKLEEAFGRAWQARVPVQLWARMMWQRWQWKTPLQPEPSLEADVTYWVLPGSGRQLLCDVWVPSDDERRTGLALIYFHGSGWQYLDKDVGTRAFFRHLTAQGHVVVDVAYRLAPEAGFVDMVGDAKRAVAWLKVNAGRLGVDPQRIVLVGGSAGAHLALMAAYTPGHPDLTPADVGNVDTTVKGVVSFYGPTDMVALMEHVSKAFPDPSHGPPKVRTNHPLYKLVAALVRVNMMLAMPEMYAWGQKRGPARLGEDQTLLEMLGGLPSEAAVNYARFSPITHAGPDSPPTLLFHGEHDYLVPASSVQALVQKLRSYGVPALAVIFPQTDHAFDLVLPAISPVAQSALYDLDRFLGIMAEEESEKKTVVRD